MPTKNGAPDILFCNFFEMYYVRSPYGKLVKLSEESVKNFYGIRFTGTSDYRGNHPKTIETIKEPVLFIKPENFYEAVDVKREPYRQELVEISAKLKYIPLEWIIIAKK
jgi:hypothetical protein